MSYSFPFFFLVYIRSCLALYKKRKIKKPYITEWLVGLASVFGPRISRVVSLYSPKGPTFRVIIIRT